MSVIFGTGTGAPNPKKEPNRSNRLILLGRLEHFWNQSLKDKRLVTSSDHPKLSPAWGQMERGEISFVRFCKQTFEWVAAVFEYDIEFYMNTLLNSFFTAGDPPSNEAILEERTKSQIIKDSGVPYNELGTVSLNLDELVDSPFGMKDTPKGWDHI